MAARLLLLALVLALPLTAAAEPCRSASRCSEVQASPDLDMAIHARQRDSSESRTLARELMTVARDQRATDDTGVEMPWIWQQLRRTAYRHLPRKRVDRFDATLAPTVVSTGFDTVAGAGVHGRF